MPNFTTLGQPWVKSKELGEWEGSNNGVNGGHYIGVSVFLQCIREQFKKIPLTPMRVGARLPALRTLDPPLGPQI